MTRKSQLDLAIEQLEAEKISIQRSIDQLKQQAAKAPRVRKPKAGEKP